MSRIEISIGIISDLHCRYGKENRISTHLYTEITSNPKAHHPVEALKQLIDEKGLKSEILVCPGDITDKADQQGLISGWGFIKDISRSLGAKFLTATVGNHDIKSRDTAPNNDPFSVVTRFADDYPVNDAHLVDCYWSSRKHYYIWKDEKFVILNFNSSYNHINPDNALQSKITDEILQLMREELSEVEAGKIRIALFHHHPQAFSNVDQEYKDGDIIERGSELLRLLEEFDFNIVIHGHKHIPRLDYFNSKLPIFCAGSFSSLMNITDINGQNTFHIVNLVKDGGNFNGKVRTWSFTKGVGWSPCSDSNFFPRITGFSNGMDLERLMDRIVVEVSSSPDLIKFQSILNAVPELEFLTPAQQTSVTKELLEMHQIEFFPILREGPKFVSKQIT